MDNQAPSDEEVLELAQKIKAEKDIPLVEAMDIAANRLTKNSKDVDCDFEMTITLKPRVAKFFRREFSGHPTLSVEERLALYLGGVMNRLRGEALARTREDLQITEGKANTVRRSSFLEQSGQV